MPEDSYLPLYFLYTNTATTTATTAITSSMINLGKGTMEGCTQRPFLHTIHGGQFDLSLHEMVEHMPPLHLMLVGHWSEVVHV